MNIIERGENLIGFLRIYDVRTITDDSPIIEAKQLMKSMVADFNSAPFRKTVSTNSDENNQETVEMIDLDSFLMVNHARVIPIHKDHMLVVACTMGGELMGYCYLEEIYDRINKRMISAADSERYEKTYLLTMGIEES